jgi:extracellular factor (EF) 3-hydroxypalmitic acid methyl ester biosynthesis protein
LNCSSPTGGSWSGNYATDNFGRGYMEGMMDWRLRYRDEASTVDLINMTGTRREYRIYRDAPGNVVYLEVSRRWN